MEEIAKSGEEKGGAAAILAMKGVCIIAQGATKIRVNVLTSKLQILNCTVIVLDPI